MNTQRRTFLKLLGAGAIGGAVAVPIMKVLAASAAKADDDFFLFIHASGGWDVTLWADPRNEKRGIVDPATTANTDTGPLTHWVDAPFDDEAKTFQIVQPSGCKIPFGPGIGRLVEKASRLCVVNGLAMNTVSHPDGTAFSATGRHLVGGRAVASSVDTMVANEFGKESTFPCVSVNFPSFFVGDALDRRVVPLRIGAVGAITRTLARSDLYETEADRGAVTALLSQEADDLAKKSSYPDVLKGMGLQYDALQRMLKANLVEAFGASALKSAFPEFGYKGPHAGDQINAAFALEAMKRNVVRSVGFAFGGFDTHTNNYKFQARNQQDLFELVATLLEVLEKVPHPTKPSEKLADRTHILVFSDFCRTPMINIAGGRDHYPNNSALIVSPRFKGNFLYGKSDPDQLLPAQSGSFSDGARAIAPPDLLATFVSAFGVDSTKYIRDGEVVKELLAS